MLSKLFNLAKVKASAYATVINLGLPVDHGVDERGRGAWRRADKALPALPAGPWCTHVSQLPPPRG